MDPHFYNVDISWKHDRVGAMSSPELSEIIEVATPPQFPGGVDGIWSPEHLFTAAVSSCFMTTFLAIAQNSRLEYSQFECKSRGKLEKVDGKFVISEVYLEPSVTVHNEDDIRRAIRVMEKSEQNCLISRSINSKVIMEDPKVLVEVL